MPSVAQIDGLNIPGGAPAFTGLLDETYGSGAAAAFSVRRLASATTVLMRVRRDTGTGGAEDDDEADVAYDSNNILSLDSAISNASAGVTATTLGQFINVGTVGGTTYTNPDSLTVTAAAYVDEWTDQSGNGNDAVQDAQAAQPQIHDGTVDTDLITANGKPALQKTDRNPQLEFTTSLALSDFCISWAGDRDSLRDEGIMLANTALTEYLWDRSTLRFEYQWDSTTTNTGATGVGPKLYVINKNGSSINNRMNGTAYSATLAGTLNVDQAIPSGVNTWEGEINEIVVWDSSKATEQTDIEDNINEEYLIYQPTTQPTSGLLYDYGSATGGTDAAAAYSVRQLSDKAVLCMRIRRDMGAGNPGDDDETNIGFDANGDLDTAAISAFCGTGTGWVTRWWDQSVNGNHADQPVGGTGSNTSQPQIYNGTAVITENGKAAIQFDGTDDGFITSLTSSASNYGVFYVMKRTDSNGWLLDTQSGRMVMDSANNSLYFQGGFQGSAINPTTQSLIFLSLVSPSSGGVFINGVSNQSGLTYAQTAIGGTTKIGKQYDSNINSIEGNLQEFILYAADKTSDRTGIETNIDTYYQIP